jgi:hypothetical protein
MLAWVLLRSDEEASTAAPLLGLKILFASNKESDESDVRMEVEALGLTMPNPRDADHKLGRSIKDLVLKIDEDAEADCWLEVLLLLLLMLIFAGLLEALLLLFEMLFSSGGILEFTAAEEMIAWDEFEPSPREKPIILNPKKPYPPLVVEWILLTGLDTVEWAGEFAKDALRILFIAIDEPAELLARSGGGEGGFEWWWVEAVAAFTLEWKEVTIFDEDELKSDEKGDEESKEDRNGFEAEEVGEVLFVA